MYVITEEDVRGLVHIFIIFQAVQVFLMTALVAQTMSRN